MKNPYRDLEGYNCFGCSPNNPFGLKLQFREEGDFLYTEWDPSSNYEGWFDVVHGGIQATLMDEIASWVVFLKADTAGVTRSMDIKYKKPVLVSDGIITIKAKLESINRNLADIKAELISNNIVKSEALIRYFLYDEKTAKESFLFPGKDHF
ncbi:MAG: PaaI family thioesterase [Marinilabiliales bacterium]|nr:MAG: PaaI family thioesterase [Marinilabiliales bacterium]